MFTFAWAYCRAAWLNMPAETAISAPPVKLRSA